MAERQNKVMNFDINPDLYDQIKTEAERLGIPVAGFIRMLAVQYFERKTTSAENSQK